MDIGNVSSEVQMDEELLNRLKNNDRMAFELLYERYWERMLLFARKWYDDSDDALDAVHSVFVSLWEKRNKLTIISSLEGYLLTSVKYCCFTLNRKREREKANEYALAEYLCTLEPCQLSKLVEKERQSLLKRAIKKLTPTKQYIIHTRFEEGAKLEQIAADLGLSKQTVKNLQTEAVRSLRTMLTALSTLV